MTEHAMLFVRTFALHNVYHDKFHHDKDICQSHILNNLFGFSNILLSKHCLYVLMRYPFL